MARNLFELAKEREKMSSDERMKASVAGLASSFSSLAGSFIDYANVRSDMANLRVQAGQVELQAKQRANQLREQFVKSMGTYMYSAARRGVAVSSASVQSNLQGSSAALGKDIQRMEQNAAVQANAYRAQAKITKNKERNKLVQGIIQETPDIAFNAYSLFNG